MPSANECDAALEIESDSIEVLACLNLTHSKDIYPGVVGCGEADGVSSTPCPRHIGQEFRPVVSH